MIGHRTINFVSNLSVTISVPMSGRKISSQQKLWLCLQDSFGAGTTLQVSWVHLKLQYRGLQDRSNYKDNCMLKQPSFLIHCADPYCTMTEHQFYTSILRKVHFRMIGVQLLGLQFMGYKSFFRWVNPGLFLVYFQSFHTYNKLVQKINVQKCPSSIRCRDLNPQPLKIEMSPITTRPGLPSFGVESSFCSFIKCQQIKMGWSGFGILWGAAARGRKGAVSQSANRLLCKYLHKFKPIQNRFPFKQNLGMKLCVWNKSSEGKRLVCWVQ